MVSADVFQQRKPYLKKPGAGLLPDLFLLVTDLAKPDQLNRSSGHDRAWKDTSAVVDVIKPLLDLPKLRNWKKFFLMTEPAQKHKSNAILNKSIL